MKKKHIILILASVVILILIALAVIFAVRKNAEDKTAVQAMYIPYDEGSHIMVSDESGVFTVHFPEDIYDINGKKITQDQLEKGNLLKIYGNGIMMQSYPGQYPGVTKIKVVEQGSPSDADRYQELIDTLYQEPDPAEPPSLDINYRTNLAVVTAMTTRGAFRWEYKDKDGAMQSVITDAPSMLAFPDLADISLPEPADLTLLFTKKPDEVTVIRHAADHYQDQAYIETDPKGEQVEVTTSEDGQTIIPQAEAGYIYVVRGVWGTSDVEFGFLTK
ncbi:YobA family protein [Diplocloster modestus]|uniref:YobA family protein n=1 Tax=Diplocloster modestus TaxID=2850322 RepID=A0ABS6K8D5_9FIRM|nr:YobA family protein [Diplocloster modestus]MBU9726784.1 YobA family protein [Diplocloster modestus]